MALHWEQERNIHISLTKSLERYTAESKDLAFEITRGVNGDYMLLVYDENGSTVKRVKYRSLAGAEHGATHYDIQGYTAEKADFDTQVNIFLGRRLVMEVDIDKISELIRVLRKHEV